MSISQPHVRPIVRGKAGCAIEFGAKALVSVVDGFCYVDHLSWEPYNESTVWLLPGFGAKSTTLSFCARELLGGMVSSSFVGATKVEPFIERSKFFLQTVNDYLKKVGIL